MMDSVHKMSVQSTEKSLDFLYRKGTRTEQRIPYLLSRLQNISDELKLEYFKEASLFTVCGNNFVLDIHFNTDCIKSEVTFTEGSGEAEESDLSVDLNNFDFDQIEKKLLAMNTT